MLPKMSHLEKCDNFYIVKNQIYMSIAKTSITKNVTLVTKNVTDKCRFVTKNVTLVYQKCHTCYQKCHR